MHARWLTDIAMLYVRQWPSVVSNAASTHSGFATSATHAYWARSRQRFDRWQEQLSAHRDKLENAGASRRIALWQTIRPTMEEVFLSDMLVRVVAATARVLERFGVDEDASPIAHNVFTGHEDVRHRCLRMLMIPGLPVDQSIELNRIRHSLEHWTDKFLGSLFTATPVTANETETVTDATRYAFRSELVSAFIEEKREQEELSPDHSLQSDATQSSSPDESALEIRLLTTSCQHWIATHCKMIAANAPENRMIGEAALAMIRPDRVPDWSPLACNSAERMNGLLEHADQLVSQLLIPAG